MTSKPRSVLRLGHRLDHRRGDRDLAVRDDARLDQVRAALVAWLVLIALLLAAYFAVKEPPDV